jgi:glycerol uptake facilitator-like aquaporin
VLELPPEQGVLLRRLVAEALGTALLVVAIVGSGIMGERLSGGTAGLALLANSLATGAALTVLILALGPVSGAHFNPLVSLAAAWQGELLRRDAVAYAATQFVAAAVGAVAASVMFSEPAIALSRQARTGPAQLLSEFIATFALVGIIGATSRKNPKFLPFAVGAYITGAYWFTSSTSFANPAVTAARCLTATFTGIRPSDVPAFILAQTAGAAAAAVVFRWLVPPARTRADSSYSLRSQR